MMRFAVRSMMLLVCVMVAAVADGADTREEARLSRATARCSKLAELISCYEALNMKPNNPDLLMAEADALVQLKRPGEAIGVYRNASTVGADRTAVEAKIAQALSQRRALLDTCLIQQGAVAERACESAWLPGAPDEVTVFKRRGRLLQTANQLSAALDAYLAAARLAPKDRTVAHAVLVLAARSGRKDALALAAVASAKERLRVTSRTNAANTPIPWTPTPGGTGDPAADTVSNDAEVTRSN